MNNLKDLYSQLLDEGIPITELYIYHLIVSDMRSYGMEEDEIADLVEQVIDKRNETSMGLEDIVDNLLNGDEFDGDENE